MLQHECKPSGRVNYEIIKRLTLFWNITQLHFVTLTTTVHSLTRSKEHYWWLRIINHSQNFGGIFIGNQRESMKIITFFSGAILSQDRWYKIWLKMFLIRTSFRVSKFFPYMKMSYHCIAETFTLFIFIDHSK